MIQFLVGRAPGGTVVQSNWQDYARNRAAGYCGVGPTYCNPTIEETLAQEGAKPF
jgi:hypothetical protein